MDKIPERPKSKRRFVRFSLKTFLIVITLLGVVAGPYIYRAERQKRVVQWWVNGGGLYSYDFEYIDNGDYRPQAKAPGPAFLHKLIGLDYFAKLIRLDPGNVVDDLSELEDQKELQCLGVRTTSDNLAPLSRLTNLRSLGLICESVSDLPTVNDLAPLSKLTNIEVMSLRNIIANDLSPLSNLTSLKRLGLHYRAPVKDQTPVSDLTPLSGLINLKALTLTNIRANDLSSLSSLTNLKVIELRYAPVSDITPLSGLTSIELVSLANMPVSDLTPLIGLPNLKTLVVTKMTVSDDEIARFKQAMPNCEVKTNR